MKTAIISYFRGMRNLIVFSVKMDDAFIFGGFCYVIVALFSFGILAVMIESVASVLSGLLGFDIFLGLIFPIAIFVAPSVWVGGFLTSERMFWIFGLYRIVGIKGRVISSAIKRSLNL